MEQKSKRNHKCRLLLWLMADGKKSFLYLILFDRQWFPILNNFHRWLSWLFLFDFFSSIYLHINSLQLPKMQKIFIFHFLLIWISTISSSIILHLLSIRFSVSAHYRRKQNHKLEKVSTFGDFYLFFLQHIDSFGFLFNFVYFLFFPGKSEQMNLVIGELVALLCALLMRY